MFLSSGNSSADFCIRNVGSKCGHIYTVETVDDALTILMEQEAGKISSKGRYPKNSINYHAVNRLYNIALIVNGGDGE